MKPTTDTDAKCKLEPRFAGEGQMLQGMARRLTADADARSASRGEQVREAPVTVAAVLGGLEDDDMLRREAAAFVAGRCRAPSKAANAALTAAVESALGRTKDAVLGIELAMSVALRGADGGRERLRAAAAETDPFAEPHKAAIYLARLEDPGGWPAIVRALSGELAHYRLMALRALPDFQPFAGRAVQGESIDPKARAVDALADDEPLVRAEAPAVLDRLGVDSLAALLRPIADADPDPRVRAAASAVLERASE